MNIKPKLVLSAMVLTILTTSVMADMVLLSDNFNSENIGVASIKLRKFA